MYEEERVFMDGCIELANKIRKGQISIQFVFDKFEQEPEYATEIVDFWMSHNSMTRDVAYQLATYKTIMTLEKCYKLEAINYPNIES